MASYDKGSEKQEGDWLGELVILPESVCQNRVVVTSECMLCVPPGWAAVFLLPDRSAHFAVQF